MTSRAPIVAGAVGILLAASAAGAGSESTAPASGASARSYAIRVIVPGQTTGGTRELAAPPRSVQFVGGFAYPGDGSLIRTGAATTSVSAGVDASRATASAASDVSSISLFNGEVTIAKVVARANATASAGRATGDTARSGVSGLAVNGQAVGVGPGSNVPLGDWGYAIVLAQGSSPSTAGYRGFVTGIEIRVTSDHAGAPAGTTITIGYAEAAAAAPKPAAAPEPSSPTKPRQSGTTAKAPARPKPERATAATPGRAGPPIRIDIPRIKPQLTRGGYVFPVFGPAVFSSTFGAPRATTIWHHGEDIFAPMGAPVLAVADGTLFSVGWNDVGGNRLWLRDRQGNEFYYAHLSAFSPLAVNGARVRAGDVIGFVGDTGDAEGTPPHLHFEFHFVGLLALGYDLSAVDPYPYLIAWQRLEDVRFVAGARWVPAVDGTSQAPTPGAFLLSSSDISSASGLDPASLARALREVSAEVGADAQRRSTRVFPLVPR